MSELDKLTYSTTYRQDFGIAAKNVGISHTAEPGKVDCRPKVYVGQATGGQCENSLSPCPGHVGGAKPKLGATANGLPTILVKDRSGDDGRGTQLPPPMNKEELAEMMYKAAETGNIKPDCSTCQNKPDVNPLIQPTSWKTALQVSEPPPQPKDLRPVPIGQFGGLYEGPLNREYVDQTRNDQAMPYSFDKPCVCPPGRPESGPQNYGPAWIRSRAEEKAVEERIKGGQGTATSPDPATLVIPEAMEARVSCAPEVDVSKTDQPNTFMRKLYEKYPYLYQILRDTPPEELIARVFKDRFLSTYQVDYLHMGAGKEHFPKGGEQIDEKFVAENGEVEPRMIPGCTYRASMSNGDREKFKKKKSTLKAKENEDADEDLVVREEPRVSEYMASISKLGSEIITEKLFEVEASKRRAAAASGRRSF